MDTLVGRDAVLGRLRDAVLPGQVVAVSGPPGVGKTALIRASLAGRDPVVWVTLDDARSANDVLAALGRTVGVTLGRPDRAASQVSRALRGVAVVVLDGAELLADDAWATVSVLVRDRGDVAWVVGAVVAPAVATAELQLAPLVPDDARRMLLDRASSRALGRPVDAADPAWQALADRLDGLPLALELAAGRLSLMSPGELLERLDTAVVRGSDRRTSVEGALRFAWSLLGPSERTALIGLSPARGFTLVTAEALLGPDALAVLERLRARLAIVLRDGRLHVLEGLRRIALAQAGDAERTAFVDWWVRHRADLVGRALGDEQANLRVALDLAWAAGRAADAVAIATSLVVSIRVHGPLWAIGDLPDPLPIARAAPGTGAVHLLARWSGVALQLGQLRLARELLAEALPQAEPPRPDAARSTAWAEYGWLLVTEGDLAAGLSALDEALRSAPDGPAAALALNRIAGVHHQSGDIPAAVQALEAALGHLHDPAQLRLRGAIRVNLGILRAAEGRDVEAEDLLRGAAEELVGVDEMARANAMMDLGLLALASGDLEAAATRLATARELGEQFGSELSLGFVFVASALERWCAGDRAAARTWLAAAADHQRDPDVAALATTRAWRAALEAEGGRSESLAAELAAARSDGASAALVDVLAAFGGQAVPPVVAFETFEVRIARRLLAAGRPALRCDRSGRWFERPGGRVDLARRGALQRILAALVDARTHRPGAGLSVQDVFEAGWPGERAHPDAAAARVYTAVRELRALGVGDVLRRESQGYLLDPAARIDVRS